METNKYRLSKWDILYQPKDQGGLGAVDLNTKIIALLNKWLYRLLTTNGVWQQILRNKHLGSKPLTQVEWKNDDSHFWSHLMKVKREFLHFGVVIVKGWITSLFLGGILVRWILFEIPVSFPLEYC